VRCSRRRGIRRCSSLLRCGTSAVVDRWPGGRGLAVLLIGILVCVHANLAGAQETPQPVTQEYLKIQGQRATKWQDGDTTILDVEGPVSISTDTATMSAQRCVIWLTPVPNTVLGQQHFEVSLLGNAVLTQTQITRSGDRFYASGNVRGDNISVTAEDLTTRDMRNDMGYLDASLMRPIEALPPGQLPTPEQIEKRRLLIASTQPLPTPPPTTQPKPKQPVSFSADHVNTFETQDGMIAFLLVGHVVILQTKPDGDFMDMTSERAVLFTPVHSLREMAEAQQLRTASDSVDAAYLEGDVRATFTPAMLLKRSEQRLTGDRIYYDFTTDRAVCTDAVIHTIEPARQIPVTVRAQLVKQLSVGEYRATNATLSTSEFATPSYSINADRVYMRQTDTGDPRYGNRTDYVAHGATFQAFGLPYFYEPVMTGSLTDRGTALRSLYTEDNSRFGIGVKSQWGLFETLGLLRPLDIDASFNADYFDQRGPGTGLTVDYEGGIISEDQKEPWDYKGRLESYFVDDNGEDNFGADRVNVEPPHNFRGQVLWEHQQFLPDDWQIQLRAGWVSDATFMEEWFQDEFDEDQPRDESAYIKHQKDSEALTMLVDVAPMGFVTNADRQQEQFDIERYPEIGYHRIGESFGDDDQFTFYSDNTVSALHMRQSTVSLLDQGFAAGETAGLPSEGQTGLTDQVIYRGDFRQEVNWPFAAGPFKVVPFALGRYTGYSNSPEDTSQNRVYGGMGVRASTAFWKVDDSALSELFDIHRIRHVIEPEITLMGAGANVNRDKLYLFDESVDEINNASVAEIGLHQEWQTKRGGPGQYRSVDFLTLNVEGDFYMNAPKSSDPASTPRDFRGLFFPSQPEASLARDAINADGMWRLSDTTALIGDESFNLDYNKLATTALGVNVGRDTRLRYYAGLRYIGTINSTIARFAMSYQLSAVYTLITDQAYDLNKNEAQESAFTLVRHFDRFYLLFTIFYNDVSRESGVQLGFIPEGLSKTGVASDELDKYLNK
jgi:hypothetical protein